jgi:hypothetical protein
MKKLLLLSAALLMMNAEKASAKIWTVNNNVGITANFGGAQATINAASSGDTIYFEPSKQKYGDINIASKKLAIFTNSSKNGNFGISDTSYVKYATVGNITLQNADSVFLSVRFDGYIYAYSSTYLTISNCFGLPAKINGVDIFPLGSLNKGRVFTDNCTHLKISKSTLSSAYINNGCYIEVRNNIFAHSITSSFQSFCGGLAVINNSFYTDPLGPYHLPSTYVDTLKSAIVIDNTYGYRTNTYFVNCVLQGNEEVNDGNIVGINNLMGPSTAMPGSYIDGNSSITSYDLFGSSTLLPYSNLEDVNWCLNYGSKGAGKGSDPYIIHAPPPIPAVKNLQVLPLVNNGILNIQFSSISNK